MKRRNNIGDEGSPCSSPRLTLKNYDKLVLFVNFTHD